MLESESIDVSKTEEPICLIDGDSLLYYEMDKPTLEEAVAGINSRVETILSNCETNKYVGFLTGSDCFRYQVDKSYKAHRKHKPKPIIFYALREHIKQHWKFDTFPKLEADDLVSYYGHTMPESTIICSPDKDVLKQCVGRHFNYQKVEFVETSSAEATKFLWKQVLMGDSTDHIQGLPGVGEKTSENWLQDRDKEFESFVIRKYVEKFGEVEGVIQFNTTFRLVYILKTPQDVMREIGLPELPPLTINTFSTYDSDPTASDLWG
jgi:5'-3' exonuclease